MSREHAHGHGGQSMHGERGGHGGHGDHNGHDHGDHVARFRRLFWVMLVVAAPVVAFSPMFASLLGYAVPSGATWCRRCWGP